MGAPAKKPRVAKVKNGNAPRNCEACGLDFEWRKKWRNNFDEVKYCSRRCAGEAEIQRRHTKQ